MVLRFCSASQIVFLPEALTRPGDRRSIHAEDDADGPKESCFVVVLFVSLWPVAHGLVCVNMLDYASGSASEPN